MSRASPREFHLSLSEQSKKMLSTPLSHVHHQYRRELPTLQNWPIRCRGDARKSGLPGSCQLSHSTGLAVSLGGCLPRGWGTRVLTAESCGAGAEPRAWPCRLDTFLQLLREAKSQKSTCCFTYSCQRGKTRLKPGCCRLPSLAADGFCPVL